MRDARSRLKSFVATGALAWSCVLLLALPPHTASAQATSLWSIGQADHNNSDFALAPDHWSHYSGDAAYVIGQSHPQADWPYVEPGPDDAWAGRQSHTANIYFSLDQAAKSGSCRLTISLLDAQHQLPPQLQIRINNRSWTRDTVAGNGDASINGQPSAGKPSAISIDFPASVLHAGTNEVSIKTLRGSWILYDAISLSAPVGFALGAPPAVLHLANAEWLHDVLVRKGNTLRQVLQLQALNTGPPRTVSLHVAGEPDSPIRLATGRSTVEVEFPEYHRAQQPNVQIFESGKPIEPALTTDRLPCRKYTVYCLEHSHMDIGYGYTQPVSLALHQKYLEDALTQIPKYSAWPSDDRFRWNIESLVEIDDWLKKASPAQIAAFQKAVRGGDLGLSALYCNELTGLCRPEELAALLTCANDIRTKYDVSIDSAMVSDVPGLTWGLVPMLAQGGVKYLSLGPNPGDHLGNDRDQDNQAFYWLSPSGKDRVLVWQGPNGYQPDFAPNQTSLVRFLAAFDQRFPHAPYDMIYDRHTRGDNAPADLDLPMFVHNWNSQHAYPHLIIATTSQMFHDFEKRYGKTLRKVRGDATGYWEDGAASTAAATAVNRAAAESTAQDEFLWAMLKPSQYPYARFADAWKNIVLYDEHTWGAWNSWSDPESAFVTGQWAIKKAFATDAQQQALALRDDALNPGESKLPSSVSVFNTCSWQRTDIVVLPAALSRAGDRVQNEQGDDVPSQRLSDGTLAFLAVNIPALSSRKFTVISGRSRYAGSASASADSLIAARIAIRFDPKSGVIASWKANGITRDLVNPADKTCRGLNDYLYVLGPLNTNVQCASGAKLTVVDSGPLVASVRIDSLAPGAKSLSRLVQVVDGLNEVRIADTVDKLPVHEDEAVDIGFNFNIPSSVVRMDMPWSVVRPNIDQTSYANKSVFPVSRWVDVCNSTDGVTCATLDSPMLQIGAITLPRENSNAWLKTANSGSTLYWSVMNNYWHTNYKAYQSGPVTFRYALQAHAKYDQSAAQHFGIGQSQPLLFAPVDASQPDAKLPLSFSNDAVLVTTCHPIDNTRDWIVRLFNSSDKAQTEDIRGDGAERKNAYETDLWGGHAKPVALPLHLVPMQVVTLRIAP